MKIAIIGSGYVGLVTGACLSDFGLEVVCVDKDQEKIDLLKQGSIPIYEPGLDLIVEKNMREKRLSFSTDLRSAVEYAEVIFIAVGTPSGEDGSADMSYVHASAKEIAESMNSYKVIVNKSTSPIGTAREIKAIIRDTLDRRKAAVDFDVVSNPEFLREGSAVYDFTHPDRIVIGSESKKAEDIMKSVYNVLYINEAPFILTSIESAELIKYASNAFLAMKITFINEIANLCEKVGANVKDVSKGIGKDGRIGSKFLHAGPGYGGSCFPKDTRALAYIGKQYGSPMTLVESTIQANEKQLVIGVKKVRELYGDDLTGKAIAILGLSFKPNTDDMREAPALYLVEELCKLGATVHAYDPIAMEEAKRRFRGLSTQIRYFDDEYEAIEGTDCTMIVTEWNQFRNIDFDRFKMISKRSVLFDLRNIYNRRTVENQGIEYYGIGQ